MALVGVACWVCNPGVHVTVDSAINICAFPSGHISIQALCTLKCTDIPLIDW